MTKNYFITITLIDDFLIKLYILILNYYIK